MKVLVINDFARKGGAEEVYRTSVDVLRAQPGVEVATFDERAFALTQGGAARAWNAPAARALAAVLEREAPQRVLVHNYHNLLSPSIVPVIARYKRRTGCRAYLTCHDYHLVFYNPNLLTYPRGRATPLPLDALARGTRLFERSSPRGAASRAPRCCTIRSAPRSRRASRNARSASGSISHSSAASIRKRGSTNFSSSRARRASSASRA